LQPNSWGAGIIDQLAPLAGDIVVDKAGYSAFDATDLEQRLRQRNIKTLIVCGVVTYACVLATSFAAFDRGFDVILARDATGTWSDALAGATSQIVDLLLGHSVSIDEITFSSNTAHATMATASIARP
jgi:nicotinamidase-related amidase